MREIVREEERGVTLFPFSNGNTHFVGVIDGTGDAEFNYAVMLEELVSSQLKAARNKGDVRGILLGEATAVETQRYMRDHALPEIPCYVLCFYAERAMLDIEDIIRQAATNESDFVVPLEATACALVKFDKDDMDYQSATDYAGFLAGSIFEETGVHPLIGVGSGGSSFMSVATSYFQASTAVRMCRTFHSKGDIHTYREYLLVKMLEEIPERKLKEYLKELLTEEAEEMLDDEDMLNTAEEFLLNSLNISETSRNLYMHRNTLMYRLDKIERITGMNIRNFPDAVSFRVLTILYKLIK